jgi:hypothetical protein
MLVKTGDAQIIDVVDAQETEDDDKRKDALAAALDRAKKRISDAPERSADKKITETECLSN